jgi:hypothetical protein
MSWLSKFVNDVTGKSVRRAAERASNAQIQALDEEKAAFAAERSDLEAQKDRERKRIESKQIRALKRTRRAKSFMDEPVSEVKSTLG